MGDVILQDILNNIMKNLDLCLIQSKFFSSIITFLSPRACLSHLHGLRLRGEAEEWNGTIGKSKAILTDILIQTWQDDISTSICKNQVHKG